MIRAIPNADVRLMLASMGLLAVAIAILAAALAPPPWEHCLQTAVGIAPHCGACYAAVLLFAAAMLPWPRAVARSRTAVRQT